MRRFGQFLASLGLLLGVLIGLSLFAPLTFTGWSWLVAVGMVKLSLLSSVGLIAGGAFLQRFAHRREMLALEAETSPVPPES